MRWNPTRQQLASAASAALGAAFAAAPFVSPAESAIAALSVFSIALFYFMKKPVWSENRRLRRLEESLPLALQSLALELSMGTPFEKSVERVALGNYGTASAEFKKAFVEMRELGSSAPEAFFRFSERNPSVLARRSAGLIVSCYDRGSAESVQSIQRFAKEMLSQHRANRKAWSAKMSLYAMAFIALSAILPALFQSYLMAGSLFLEPSLNAAQSLIVIAVVFPALNALLLYYIHWNDPNATARP